MKLSRKFLIQLKLHREPAYRLAHAADLDPSALSAWIRGIRLPKKDDPRLLRLATLLQVRPEDVFEVEAEKSSATQEEVKR